MGMHAWPELCVCGAGAAGPPIGETAYRSTLPPLSALLLHSSSLSHNRALNSHLLSAALALPLVNRSPQLETRFKCKSVLREGLGENPIGRLDLSLVASRQGRVL